MLKLDRDDARLAQTSPIRSLQWRIRMGECGAGETETRPDPEEDPLVKQGPPQRDETT